MIKDWPASLSGLVSWPLFLFLLSENGNIDHCYSHPCLNGGTCTDQQDGFMCSCPHLFNGTMCENDLSVYGCAVNPCLFGGTCVDETTNPDATRPYRCACTQGKWLALHSN